MDPLITVPMLTSALAKVLDTAAGEAGTAAWAALAAIIGRHRKRVAPDADLPVVAPGSPDEAEALAAALAGSATFDPALAAELRDWQAAVELNVSIRVQTGAGQVGNAISGTVHGSVVQARDVTGPITFG